MKLLIRSTTELRQVVTFSGDIEYDAIKPALASAQAFVARYVGSALIEELAGREEGPDDDQAELRDYLWVPIGNLALLKYASAGTVKITDSGLMRTKTANTADAFEWQVERTVSMLKQEAFDGLEALLRYLETKLDTFPAYRDSDEYKADKGRLIRSAAVFNQYYEIGSSRLILQTLQAALRTSEGRIIRPILGDRLTALLGDTLTETQQVQLDAARRVLVYATIARALRERLVSLTDQGVQVLGISNFGTLRYQQAPSDKQLEQVITHFDAETAVAINELSAVLQPVSTTPKPPVSRVSGTKIVAF